MSDFNVFDKTIEFARRNYFVDVEDKIPIFLCSVGVISSTHLTSVADVTSTPTVLL